MITRFVKIVFILLLLLGEVSAGEERPELSRLRAGFLYNFFNYIQWPLPLDRAPLLVVAADPAQTEIITLAVSGKALPGGRTLQVLSGTNCQNLAQADMVYASREFTEEVMACFAGTLPPLLVGEERGFVEQGGHLAIVAGDGKMELLVDLGLASDDGFRISSKLLRLATLVDQAEAEDEP